MSDRTTSQWRVKVNGGTQVAVRPGECLEIGRRPIRPLPDTGVARLEVEDSAKSMSKRHALLTVTADGDALLRDLNSTNGSYVVNADGELMRLPAGRDFPLPTSPIRLQFGDVPIDFVRVDQPEPESRPAAPQVPNLFDYTSPTAAHQEPDAADMSVEDILDLRAGEPTAVFAEQSARPAVAPIQPSPIRSLAGVAPVPGAGVAPVPGADDAADAAGTAAPIVAATTGDEPETDFHVDFASDAAHPADQVPLHLGDARTEPAPRDLFADAADAVVEPDPAPVVEPIRQIEPVQPATQPTVDNTVPMENQPIEQTEPAVQQAEQTEQAGPAEDHPTEFVINQTVVAGTTPVSAFGHEPGSVFEKVSNGDFDRPEPQVIEVDGYTSDDAQRVTDMTKQFEMARHRELLPFLAMNPSLYDDLYAWLAAQGNGDIDEALAHNEGYREYREAIGK